MKIYLHWGLINLNVIIVSNTHTLTPNTVQRSSVLSWFRVFEMRHFRTPTDTNQIVIIPCCKTSDHEMCVAMANQNCQNGIPIFNSAWLKEKFKVFHVPQTKQSCLQAKKRAQRICRAVNTLYKPQLEAPLSLFSHHQICTVIKLYVFSRLCLCVCVCICIFVVNYKCTFFTFILSLSLVASFFISKFMA